MLSSCLFNLYVKYIIQYDRLDESEAGIKIAGRNINKLRYAYTMEYYSTIKKNEMMPFAATWVEVEIMMLSEVDQTEKDK